MSRAAKQSLLILFILLCAAVVFSAITASQKASVEQAKNSLEQELAEYRVREAKVLAESKDLKEKMQQLEQVKNELEQKLSAIDKDIPSLEERIRNLSAERDQLTQRADSLVKEKEALEAKIKEQPQEKIVYKYIEKTPDEGTSGEPSQAVPSMPGAVPGEEDESYWAQVLKEKVALEMGLEKLKENLTVNAVELVELKKQNSDLQLELGRIRNEKENIEREIKHGKDLANNLALELARAKNDKKFVSDRLDKMQKENLNLQDQIRQLSSTKIALEKSIVRLQDDKKAIEKKLLQTENVIQSRIDEIWKIKENLDEEFKPASLPGQSRAVELPPIVVSADSPAAQASGVDNIRVSVDPNIGKLPGAEGSVVSVNEENNFVIVDLGENSGLMLGDSLSVYRGTSYIAGLEIIQVRKDISAADIKNQVAKIQIGDIVR